MPYREGCDAESAGVAAYATLPKALTRFPRLRNLLKPALTPVPPGPGLGQVVGPLQAGRGGTHVLRIWPEISSLIADKVGGLRATSPASAREGVGEGRGLSSTQAS